MTELEKMQRAKMYVDKLANGIDPISDTPAAEDDCINNVRVSRCLFYVSDVLRKVIESDGEVKKKAKKVPFEITYEELSRFVPSPTPISVSELARRISDLVGEKPMAKLKYSVITEFLIDNGFLIQSIDKDGKKQKTPTELGKSIGISTEKRIGSNGQYDVTLYSSMAQQFIIDNLYAILNDKK